MAHRYKPLIVAIATLALLDFGGIITMIVSPDLTARLIPALVAVQILGLTAIAVICLRQRPEEYGRDGATSSASLSKDWRIWLISGIAMLFFFRALLALGYMAYHGWRGHQVIVPATGFLISCYLFYLAFAIKRRSKRQRSADPPPQ